MKRQILSVALILSITFLSAYDLCALSEHCDLAEKLYLQGSYKSAAYECERLFREYKKKIERCEIAYLAGLVYLKLNDFTNARLYFEYILNHSDDSFLIDEAQIGLSNIKDTGSIKEPSFYSIQLGSFKYKWNANRLYKKFKRKKYTVRMVSDKDGKKTVYKVKIGKFKSRDDAVRSARKLRKQGYSTAIVAY